MNIHRVVILGTSLTLSLATSLAGQDTTKARPAARPAPARAAMPARAPVGPAPAAAPTATSVNPASGPLAGGTSITILGTNFIAGATATIDGKTVAGLVVVSSTQLTGTTPQGTGGSKDVVVTTSGGRATCAHCFTYGQPLLPGESIEEAWERSGEGPRGLWTVEVLQKGVGESIGLTGHCPSGTRAIGAGIENSSMTPFAVWQSYPKSGAAPGWYILMHRNLVPAIDGGNPYPPTPYTFFMTVTCIDVAAWQKAMTTTSP